MDEGEEVYEEVTHLGAIGKRIVKPFHGGGFTLEIRVGRRDGEDGLAPGDVVCLALVPVIQLDAENLCEAMAYFR